MVTQTSQRETPSFDAIEDAVAAIGRGEIIVVVDDEDRENEGDLIMAAEFATEETIAFFVNHTSGLICAPISDERADELDLPLMVERNTEILRTAFTVSIDLAKGTSTGISAADRALTIRSLVDDVTTAADYNRPGHVFPLRARAGGVLKRAGHTEAALDLTALAGLSAGGVLCEVVNEDGTMARVPDLLEFCKTHDLVMISIADLIRYRRQSEKLVKQVSHATIPTRHGDFRSVVYEPTLGGEQHVAFVMGEPSDIENILVRVHSECLTGDIFGSLRCDCGPQLEMALELIAKEGQGVLVYLRGHEGRGIGIGHKIRAYNLQEEGLDTVEANLRLGLPADSREYGIGAQILVDLGVTSMRLITNNPAKYGGLDGYGLRIVDRVPIETMPTDENLAYLKTKRERMGHLLSFEDDTDSSV